MVEVIQVLDAIGVEQKTFFTELYGLPSRAGARDAEAPKAEAPKAEQAYAELAEIASVVESIVDLLVANGAFTAGELTRMIAARAVMARAGDPLLPEVGDSAPKKKGRS